MPPLTAPSYARLASRFINHEAKRWRWKQGNCDSADCLKCIYIYSLEMKQLH